MARHRNVRNYDYDDDMSEDVYGHSVEDHELCMSPSTAEFMYNRHHEEEKKHFFGNYMDARFGSVEEEKEEEEEQSEEEDHLSHSHDYTRPQLDPISHAKLSSCLDQLQSILGDDCHEPTAVEAIIKFNFDAEKALDYIFNKESDKTRSKQSKKIDSNLCFKISDKLKHNCEPITNLSALSTTTHHEISPITTSSTISLPLNSLIKQEQDINYLTSTFSQDTQNNNSPVQSHNPLFAMLPKSLPEGEKGLSTNPSSTFANELMNVSLSSLTSTGLTGPSMGKTDELMMTSLASLTSKGPSKGSSVSPYSDISSKDPLKTTSLSKQQEIKDMADLPTSVSSDMMDSGQLQSLSSLVNPSSVKKSAQPKFSETNQLLTENLLIETSLSRLASKNRLSSLLPSPSTINNVSSGSLQMTSLSGLASANEQKQSDLPHQSSYDLPNAKLMTSSLSSLASTNEQRQRDVSDQSSHLLHSELMTSSLSSLASENTGKSCHSSPELNTSTLAHDELMTTSLSSLAKENAGKSLGLSSKFNANSIDEGNLMTTSLSSLASLDACREVSGLTSNMDVCLKRHLSASGRSAELPSASDMISQQGHSIPLQLSNMNTNQSRKPQEMMHLPSLSQEMLQSSLANLTLANQDKANPLSMTSSTPQLPKMCELPLKFPKSKNTKPKKKIDLGTKGPGLTNTSTIKFKAKHRISPSMFAVTLCQHIKRKSSIIRKRFSSIERCYENTSNIKPFDFLTPSPDNCIHVKQSQGFAHMKH